MPSRKPYPGDKDKRPWVTRVLRMPEEVAVILDTAMNQTVTLGVANSTVEAIEAMATNQLQELQTFEELLPQEVETPDSRFRRVVRERDDNRCIDCGSRNQLHVHHIVTRNECRKSGYLELLVDPDNGVTLCWECHDAVTGCEREHAERFNRYVEQVNVERTGLCEECAQ